MSVIDTLTEGIRQRSLANEGEALMNKWERTGLLEGLDEIGRNNMARLLENQAGQLLKETSTMQAGDVQGFASVAFPIVRRVFGNLLAQDLVSVQPMSLPSGLIFFLDFVFSPDGGMSGSVPKVRVGNLADTSIYGGGVVGAQLTAGVSLAERLSQGSFYALNNGFSSPSGSGHAWMGVHASGTYGDAKSAPGTDVYKILQADASLISGTSAYVITRASASFFSGVLSGDLRSIAISGATANDTLGSSSAATAFHARRLNQFSGSLETHVLMVGIDSTPSGEVTASLNEMLTQMTGARGGAGATSLVETSWARTDAFQAVGGALGAIEGTTPWGLENSGQLPEIDIKVQSVAVTANTKKLKAKWSPELAQDLNAYHNLDAEVELTSILSEQIALEIDQEILSALVQEGTGGILWWSRKPGKFVNRDTGAAVGNTLYPDFTGTVSEWYETLLETVNEVSARIHRKTLRGGANFLVCSPEVANILEFTAGFRAAAAVDEEGGSWGVKQVGSISRKMDIYVDPYFMRNVILVGRKGKSFLESGFVYAPYVPLQVTPTIFGTEDFVPRKGVMTRYAKKMVRPDMYGLVLVADLLG